MATTTTATTEANPLANLEEFAKGKSTTFIKFDDFDGEPIEAIYLGYAVEDDNFNPGEKKIVYELEINNERKALGSSSKRLARAMLAANVEAGNFVRITRMGEGFETNYTVETSDIPF